VMLAGGGALTLAVLAGWAGSRLLRDGVPGREELPFLPAPEEGAAVQTPGAGASSEPVFAPGSGTDTVGGVGIAAGTEAADVSRTRIASGSGGGAGGEPPIADGKAPGTAPAPGAAPAPAPRVAPSAATEGGPRAAGKPPSARAPERPEPDPAARSAAAAPDAWLDVRVRGAGGPYQVWVDGQYYGVADVAIKVPAGKHTVQVGRDAPTVTRSVRVAARARRVITVEP